MAPEFQTARLRLRRWRDEDLDAFAALNADPRVMEFFPKPLTREESDALAHRIGAQLVSSSYGRWAIEVKDTAPFIGFVGLAEPAFHAKFTPCVEIGWRLASNYWGNGYAFEAASRVIEYAFEDLGLSEIVSFTCERNVRSQRLMQRLKFTSNHNDDFEHPSLPPGHALSRHVLYRLKSC